MYKPTKNISFADLAIAERKINKSFFNSINKIINWDKIDKIINQNYSKGKRTDGRPAYLGLLLFKLCLLEEWFEINNSHIEDCVNDSLSFTYFAGLTLGDEIPSRSTIRNFKNELKKKGEFLNLIKEVEKQLKANNVELIKGVIRYPKLKIKVDD